MESEAGRLSFQSYNDGTTVVNNFPKAGSEFDVALAVPLGLACTHEPRRPFPPPLPANQRRRLCRRLVRRLDAADAASGLKGRINHSVCKWCYPKMPLDDLCRAGKEMGLTSIDLVDPPDFATLKKHGLTSAMISYPSIAGPDGEKVGSIPNGFNNPAFHDLLVQAYEPLIKASADFGAKHVICFSGNRDGMDEERASRTARRASSGCCPSPRSTASRW